MFSLYLLNNASDFSDFDTGRKLNSGATNSIKDMSKIFILIPFYIQISNIVVIFNMISSFELTIETRLNFRMRSFLFLLQIPSSFQKKYQNPEQCLFSSRYTNFNDLPCSFITQVPSAEIMTLFARHWILQKIWRRMKKNFMSFGLS